MVPGHHGTVRFYYFRQPIDICTILSKPVSSNKISLKVRWSTFVRGGFPMQLFARRRRGSIGVDYKRHRELSLD